MEQISILQLVLNASLVVQIVIGVLILFSVISWIIIFNKLSYLSSIKKDTMQFLQQFRNSNNLSTLYSTINEKKSKHSVEALFFFGLNEYNKLSKQGINTPQIMIENIERSLSATIDTEIYKYETSMSTLASFGSVSPYIGLLGTVWGIMHAFLGLTQVGSSSALSSVAPGIAEALIATAIGLIVAIPAYIFFNKFTADINQLTNQMHKFGDEFLNLITRRLISSTQN